LKKPILKVEGVSKIPVNMRQAYLDRFFDVCVLVYADDTDARQRVSMASLALITTSTAAAAVILLVLTFGSGTDPISLLIF